MPRVSGLYLGVASLLVTDFSPTGALRFLHVADIHLGCRQYHSKERQRDFYLAFDSAVERYALPLEEGGPPQVDFVIIPGDLFDQRNLQPITLSRATDVLSRLRDAGIPVIASEGNHDAARRHEPGEPNWYNFLCAEGFMIYLRDIIEGGEIILEPWDQEERSGSYIDLPSGVRIVGTQWYGAQAHVMLEKLEQALAALPPAPFTILLFHGGLTDYVNTLSAGVDYEQFLPLRPYVQYLALGHVHKRYERQGWLFNPGSLEACKLREFFEDNGAFVASLNEQWQCEVEHRSDYWRRPFLWLEQSCDLYNTPGALLEAIHELIEGEGRAQVSRLQAAWPEEVEWAKPICHLELRGTLGFPFSALSLDDIGEQVCERLGAWMFRYHNDTTPRELGQDDDLPMSEGRIDRGALERRVFTSLLLEDTRFQGVAQPLAQAAASLKQQLLDEQLDEQQREAVCGRFREILKEPVASVEEKEETPLCDEETSVTMPHGPIIASDV